ncbi:MAG: hypothetical protein ACREER_01185 [Alphaproteobacteria bacterium]
MLDKMAVLGVNDLGDSAIVIRARVKTRTSGTRATDVSALDVIAREGAKSAYVG